MSKTALLALVTAGALLVWGPSLAAVPSGSAPATPAPAAAKPAAAKPAPARAPQLFVVIYRPGPAWKKGRPLGEQALGPHGAYLRRLLEGGRLVLAGPFLGGDGGLAIIRAAGPDQAKALLAADPAITSGVLVARLEAWAPAFGVVRPRGG